MPHRILQHLLAGADHLLYPYPIFVDLECRDDPHALRLGDSRTLVDVNLSVHGGKTPGEDQHKHLDVYQCMIIVMVMIP